MKKCSPLVWVVVNLVAAVTICYVVLAVHYPPKPPLVKTTSDKSEEAPNYFNRPHRVNLREKLTAHKHRIISQLRSSLLQQKVSSKHFTLNQARFFGTQKLKDVPATKLLCNLRDTLAKSHFHTLNPKISVFPRKRRWLKKSSIIQHHFNSCAIVSSAGALLQSGLGKFIDEHEYVVRFNNAPTIGFEADVGNKTSLRILNSQIISKPHFQFNTSMLYRNVSLLVWDPSKYNSTLEEWAKKPDFPFTDAFFSRRKTRPDEELYLMDPRGLWNLWDYISLHSPLPIPLNPPSSGFIGLALTLPFCKYVDMIEFVPSMRITNRCHYYDSFEDLGCTVGDWHPLAAEKLIVLAYNPTDDQVIFDEGYVRISGFSSQNQC